MEKTVEEGDAMADLLQGLNEAQRAAVTATEGFIRVIAGTVRLPGQRATCGTSIGGILVQIGSLMGSSYDKEDAESEPDDGSGSDTLFDEEEPVYE